MRNRTSNKFWPKLSLGKIWVSVIIFYFFDFCRRDKLIIPKKNDTKLIKVKKNNKDKKESKETPPKCTSMRESYEPYLYNRAKLLTN